jgi:hypothetical protein
MTTRNRARNGPQNGPTAPVMGDAAPPTARSISTPRCCEATRLPHRNDGRKAIANLCFDQSDWQESLQASSRTVGHFEAARLPRLTSWAQLFCAIRGIAARRQGASARKGTYAS